jgi:hypothetical protein
MPTDNQAQTTVPTGSLLVRFEGVAVRLTPYCLAIDHIETTIGFKRLFELFVGSQGIIRAMRQRFTTIS